MTDVLVYGSIGYDILTFIPHMPEPGKDAPVLREERHVGGEACNIALALAKWGVSVAIGGNVVGNDEAGDYVLERLSDAGVDASSIGRCRKAPTPFCRVLVLPDGERHILSYGHDKTRFTLPPPTWVQETRVLVTDRFGGKLRDTLVRLAKAKGITTVSLDAIGAGDSRRDVSDVVVSSMSAAEDVVFSLDVRSACLVANSLHEIMGKTVVITDGALPACAFSASGELVEVYPPHVPHPVDTTGAGDAFAAGIVYGTLNGWGLQRSMEFAAVAAALTVQRVGADNPPALEEVMAEWK